METTGVIAQAPSSWMLIAVLACFAGAAMAPLCMRAGGRTGGLILALVPLTLLVMLLWALSGAVVGADSVRESMAWIPGLSVAASFRFDGLSMLMTMLVLGIGALVVAYSGSYFGDDPRRGRFFIYLMAFMGAMLGLVLSDNLLLMYVFWELTSLTSFLLIGFDHEKESARRSAIQGLVVTVAGGLVMLAGIVVLGEIAGSYELSDILRMPELASQPGIGVALVLIVVGCFTKSAQFPFHFWLPNAMAAPSPVSAYLHSATMVKAGVYLLARLHPGLGEHALWASLLVPFGAITMLLGSVLAFRSSGIKRVLAYTTVMALGTLTMLLGLGAAVAAMTFLMVHALYKGALFLVAGIIDHEAGAKDIREVGGLAGKLPVTAAFAAIAAASAAGVPPLFGFIGKELLIEEALHAGPLLAMAATASGALVAAMMATLLLRSFFGASRGPREHVHEAPWPMLAGPVILGIGSLTFGLLATLPQNAVLAAAAQAVAPGVEMKLAVWHGFNMPLALSALSLTAALVLYLAWPRLQPSFAALKWPDALGPDRSYWRLDGLLLRYAEKQTALLQNGYLRYYVLTVMAVVLAFAGTTLLRAEAGWAPSFVATDGVALVVTLLVAVAAVAALRSSTALAAVLILGVLGFGIALLYVWFSAPDLAITQVLIETLTTILLMLVLFRMPRFRQLSTRRVRAFDGAMSVAFGVLVTLLLWMVIGDREYDSIAGWFLTESVPGGHGRNVVNVILVDFRAFDTLGEIFVLALAATGVYAMLRGRTSALASGGAP